MKTSRLFVSSVAACAFASATVTADYVSPAAWSASLSSSNNSRYEIRNPNPSAIELVYWFNSPDVYGGVSATFSTTATQTGALNLDWSYAWFHAFYLPTASLTFFANSASGVVENTVYSSNVGPGALVSGSTTLNLSQGYSWGIRASGKNSDSNTDISGIVTLSAMPSPGAIALLSAFGLVGNRRRRG
ncbi:MAG TPA: hypothetical protein DCR70_08215 [Phycisphaerales bacterium]|nr:hypothetical protein [Phycisphaerales bacterium]